MEVCRICNLQKEQDDLKATVDYLASEKITYKSYFEKFTGINYSNDTSLPQKICISCQAEINLFIIKADAWNRNERAIRKQKRKAPETPAKIETAKENVKKSKTSARSSFDAVRKLFDLNEKDPLKDFEKFSRIMVDHSNLEKDGEISNQWLQENVVTKKVWNEMIFQCDCKTTVTSLIGYLNHLKNHSSVFEIKCPEDCAETFNSLSPFINHIVSSHNYEYLCYCCICCGKIFYNIPALINHYESKHPNLQNLFMCVECGSYCQNLKYLASHKTLHYPIAENTKVDAKQEVNSPMTEKDNNYLLETDISFATTNKRKRGRPKTDLNKTLPGPGSTIIKPFINMNNTISPYHPKTHKFDVSDNRVTYPCTFEGCFRVLMTKTGYDYHMMVHDGIKPFNCDYCEKSFRSKQLKDNHTRTNHEDF